MCRHLAYLGPSRPVGELLIAPPHSLCRQSYAPRRQRHGRMNVDGFGVGWYAEGDPVAARYRRAGPIWADISFTDLARVIHTGALLAAVRNASEPSADLEAAAAPFSSGAWLFSHNGKVEDWPHSVADLATTLPAPDLLRLEARCDAAFLWALTLHRLRLGHDLPAALGETTGTVAAAAPGSRLNLLLTDGETIAATAWGDTLSYLVEPGHSVVVASEPYDDDPRWADVPDRTLLTATRSDVQLTALKEASP
ncbi:ergothioneine biosynthesis protein EgtC [Streptomyces sparsogenes]|uniref:ergothioneine biosynthesis protein EgtC n=1 Tax=Streptomyces sparsogenes TaxID=67365 RepID=UPI0033FFAEF9